MYSNLNVIEFKLNEMKNPYPQFHLPYFKESINTLTWIMASILDSAEIAHTLKT
jgi:hypothetical protein